MLKIALTAAIVLLPAAAGQEWQPLENLALGQPRV